MYLFFNTGSKWICLKGPDAHTGCRSRTDSCFYCHLWQFFGLSQCRQPLSRQTSKECLQGTVPIRDRLPVEGLLQGISCYSITLMVPFHIIVARGWFHWLFGSVGGERQAARWLLQEGKKHDAPESWNSPWVANYRYIHMFELVCFICTFHCRCSPVICGAGEVCLHNSGCVGIHVKPTLSRPAAASFFGRQRQRGRVNENTCALRVINSACAHVRGNCRGSAQGKGLQVL